MTIHISLLFLHKRRIGDLRMWLRSIELEQSINILLLISNQTQNAVDELIADSTHAIEVINLDLQTSKAPLQPKQSAIANFWAELCFSFSEFNRSYKRAKTVLRPYRNTVIVTYDNRMPTILAILRAAKMLGLPVFLPSVLASKPSRDVTTANTLKPIRQVEKWLVRLIRPLLPNQISNEERLYYDPISLLVLLFYRVLPEDPWATGNQRLVDRIGVESELVKTDLLSFGVPEKKLVVTGLPVYDFMDFSKVNATTSIPQLILALPQYAEHGAMKLDAALNIIRPILQAIKSFDGRVVVSLHPRMDPSDYQALLEEFEFEWMVGGIDRLIKQASVFVATNTSSTIYWALMLGIPTIILNHVYPKSNAFRHFESLRYVDEDVCTELPHYLCTPQNNFSTLIASDQDKLSMPLIRKDRCGKRNLAIISALIESDRKSSQTQT